MFPSQLLTSSATLLGSHSLWHVWLHAPHWLPDTTLLVFLPPHWPFLPSLLWGLSLSLLIFNFGELQGSILLYLFSLPRVLVHIHTTHAPFHTSSSSLPPEQLPGHLCWVSPSLLKCNTSRAGLFSPLTLLLPHLHHIWWIGSSNSVFPVAYTKGVKSHPRLYSFLIHIHPVFKVHAACDYSLARHQLFSSLRHYSLWPVLLQ